MPDNERVLTFTEHLEELRSRLFVCVIALVVGTFIAYFVSLYVLSFLRYPLSRMKPRDANPPIRVVIGEGGRISIPEFIGSESKEEFSRNRIEFYDEKSGKSFVFGPDSSRDLFYFNPIEPFILRLKAALILGVLLALPVILSQMWRFVAPGLTKTERKYVKPLGLMGLVLFPIGALFAFFCVQFALRFLASFAFPGYEYWPNANEYLNFVLTMMLIMGGVFELPLVLLFLAVVGVISSSMLRKNRPIAILIIMIISMMATPADPFTMLAMGIPLIILYEISIWVALPLERKRKAEEEG